MASADAAADRAARWLAAWDSQGLHRTGTDGDAAGAAWLASETQALGADVSSESFALERLDPIDCFLELDGTRIAAIPAFDAPATGSDGIVGRLGLASAETEIAVARLSPQAVYSGEYQRLRHYHHVRGLVIVCAGNGPGMALLNAEGFRDPHGPPTIHIAAEAGNAVLAAAAHGAQVRLVAHSRRTPATASNNVVRLPGRDRAAPPLVVMTPRSSWWQSTAERGGGIVCWLECLRALIGDARKRLVVFSANSGHELDHLGLDDFVARRPGWEETATWLHWGANIGAAGGGLTIVSASDDLRDLAAAELERAGQPFALAPKSTVPSGETRDIHKKGGRYLTFVGSNRWFHQPDDRWPQTIDLTAVTRIAAGAARLASVIARE
jgi:hypothetical protein